MRLIITSTLSFMLFMFSAVAQNNNDWAQAIPINIEANNFQQTPPPINEPYSFMYQNKKFDDETGAGSRYEMLYPRLGTEKWQNDWVANGFNIEIDTANDVAILDETSFLYGADSLSTPLGVTSLFTWSTGDAFQREIGHSARALQSLRTDGKGPIWDKIWVSVYRPNGERKWQLMQIEQV
jgi:hypothetical protein